MPSRPHNSHNTTNQIMHSRPFELIIQHISSSAFKAIYIKSYLLGPTNHIIRITQSNREFENYREQIMPLRTYKSYNAIEAYTKI